MLAVLILATVPLRIGTVASGKTANKNTEMNCSRRCLPPIPLVQRRHRLRRPYDGELSFRLLPPTIGI